MSKDTISVNMNVYDIPILVEQLEKANKEIQRLKEEYVMLQNAGDEVEIIEQDKKIEKLEHWVDVKSWVKGNDLEKGLEEQSKFNKNIYYKINEIIDYINEGDK